MGVVHPIFANEISLRPLYIVLNQIIRKKLSIEEKELLFKDLSARLPYHVRVKVWLKDGTTEEGPLDIEHNYGDVLRDAFYYNNKIKDIKPYLRPMSSMTEKEEKEFAEIVVKSQDCSYENNESATTMVNDWYLSKGFDVRGLIPRNLALEAKEGMYNIKKK